MGEKSHIKLAGVQYTTTTDYRVTLDHDLSAGSMILLSEAIETEENGGVRAWVLLDLKAEEPS